MSYGCVEYGVRTFVKWNERSCLRRVKENCLFAFGEYKFTLSLRNSTGISARLDTIPTFNG